MERVRLENLGIKLYALNRDWVTEYCWLKTCVPWMFLKSCLLHIDIIVQRDVVFCMLVSMSPSRSAYVLFMWSIFHYNHIISLKHLFFSTFFVKMSASVLCLVFCITFCQFPPGVAYESVAYKKACIRQDLSMVDKKRGT